MLSDRILMGPGPCNPYPEVVAALGRPMLGHLDPDFLVVLDETCDRLRSVFQTSNALTLPISGTGSAGMEAAFVNVVIASRGKTGSVERVMANRDDILDALFERTFTAISPSAQRVFLTLCNWRSSVPRLGVEAALLRPANERMDVGAAIDVLELSSLIEVVGGPEPADQFLRVPLAAAMFGRKKLTVSSMRNAIDDDTEILRLFGAANVHEAARGLAPRIGRLVASIAVDLQQGRDVADGVAVLEFIARQFAPAWIQLADLYDEHPDAEKGMTASIEALRHFLETSPDDVAVWRRLAATYGRAGDAFGEMHAQFRAAQSPESSFNDISLAANRFNELAASGALMGNPDERRSMAIRIRQLLLDAGDEADATAFSRLAWLSLHVKEEAAARDYTRQGLALEPYNFHCRRLAERLGIVLTDS